MLGPKFVVSDIGDILSPKLCPSNTAPAVIPIEIPRASPIPINAIPTVAEVVQELPVAIEMIAQIIKQAAKKIGWIQHLQSIINHGRNNTTNQPSTC